MIAEGKGWQIETDEDRNLVGMRVTSRGTAKDYMWCIRGLNDSQILLQNAWYSMIRQIVFLKFDIND